MAKPFDLSKIQELEKLARLRLSPDEQALYAKQLGDILGYVELLKEVEVAGVEPLTHPHADSIQATPMREDRVIRPEEFSSADPENQGYRVPPIL